MGRVQRHCAQTRARYRLNPREARRQARSKGSGSGGLPAASGCLAGQPERRGHLHGTSPRPQAGTLGRRKSRELAQRPAAPEAAAYPTLNPHLAPSGGPGAPGGEFALTCRAQAERATQRPARPSWTLTRDRNNPSAPRGPVQALPLPATCWGGGGRSPRTPRRLGKRRSSWRSGSPCAV